MSRLQKLVSTLALSLFLAACGGGENAGTNAATSAANPAATQLSPTVYTSEGRILNSCIFSPACSGIPTAPFYSITKMAPADGATVSGIVRLEVDGNEMANVELLPATGYTPRLGVFNLSGDGTRAWLDLDTTKLPNGPLNVRISAFNVPPGQGGTEIVTMPARTWTIANAATPPATFTAAVSAAPADGAVVSGIIHLELHGSGIVNAELLPESGYTPRLGVFNVSADRSTATLDFDTRSLPDGVTAVRISAFNTTAGQPGSTEIVAMPVRHWNFSNGKAQPPAVPFTASVTIAPPHGEVLSGVSVLEVRGTNLQNVELLPATGYLPRLGVFAISGDGKFAWLRLDTSTLPNGVLAARISAFDQPAGQNAAEIIAMPVREWELRH
jgi:predicted Rdx family selenoprotein